MRTIFVLALGCLLVSITSPAQAQTLTVNAATVVQVDKTLSGVSYKVDSKPTGCKPTDDLLHALNQVADRNGVNHPVRVVIDPRLPIEEIWNVGGVAAKAQLNNVRFFVLFRESQKITELKWTPLAPFSTDPR